MKSSNEKALKMRLAKLETEKRRQEQEEEEEHPKPPLFIYPFFLLHMFFFGGSGFMLAYFTDVPLIVLFIHGGIAIFVYLLFYTGFFGIDAIKWMFINAALGTFGIYSELRFLLLHHFDKDIADYSIITHIIPFTYYVLYTFLLYQAVLSFSGAHNHPNRKTFVEIAYVAISLLIYSRFYFNA